MTIRDENDRYPGLKVLTDDDLDAKIAERLNMVIETEERLSSISRALQRAVDEKNYRLDNPDQSPVD